MGIVSLSLPSDGTAADVADYNTPITTLADEFNGGIDNDNIASDAAIAGTKLATDGVTDTQLDYPRWWQEIGRTTLGSAGDTITVSSLPVRKYLRIIFSRIDTGGAVNGFIRFNNDSGANYSSRFSDAGAADTTTVSQTSARVHNSVASPGHSVVDVVNVAAHEKVFSFFASDRGTAGAGNAPGRIEGSGKWANTADAITRVDVINTAAGDFATGSEVIVLGHD